MTSASTTMSLGNYLTATVTVGTLASSASAAIVNLDVSTISAANGGVALGNMSSLSLASLGSSLTGTIDIFNASGYFFSYTGLSGTNGMEFAIYQTESSEFTKPRNFLAGSVIDSDQHFDFLVSYSAFKMDSTVFSGESPDFGSGSYMGFRVDDGNGSYNYGWLEVTWSSATDTFQIFAGAYEDQPGVGILAGATAITAIPEPGSAMGTLGILAAGMMIRRRSKKAA